MPRRERAGAAEAGFDAMIAKLETKYGQSKAKGAKKRKT